MPRGPATTPSRARALRETRVVACTNCRSRKTKCDGGHPECKTCQVYNDTCRYDATPSMSQVAALSQKVMSLERTIERLERERLGASTADFPLPEDVSAEHGVVENSPALEVDLTDNSTRLPYESGVTEGQSLYLEAPRNANGSLLHRTSKPTQSPSVNTLSPLDPRSNLTAAAIESRAWEHFALGNAALRLGIQHETLVELMKLHWSWIAPGFMWVYRPAFMRDMATGGQYCSELLLTVLCAHSSRFRDHSVGESLVARARLLLGTEIQKPCAIATAQALLQLSARDLAFGSVSQAWLYSGMAFRMVSDLDLYRNTSVTGSDDTSPEDNEIRKRLFWSCYFWDKAISLYLGRMPTLTDLPSERDIVLLDESAEHDTWSPYSGTSQNLGYPPRKAHAVSCFQNSCKLAIILNDIIQAFYSRRQPANAEQAVHNIAIALRDWRTNTPAHLRYDPTDLPNTCGPPHIVTQNLLYFTARILLHRPFSAGTEHRTACREAADSIEKLLRHFEGTFGFTHITYLMAYCVYTGASTTVQNVTDGNSDAIETYIRALRGSCKTCPGVQRSLDIIQQRKDNLAQQSMTTLQMEEHSQHYLPAFPQYGPYDGYTDGYSGEDHQFGAFNMLECFPEAHLHQGSGDWYLDGDLH